MLHKSISFLVIISFICSLVTPVPKAHAGDLIGLPKPGEMVSLSPAYVPAMIKGLTVHKDNPFLFDFIVDIGQDRLVGQALKDEGNKLIKYFLASLAIPEKDLWVNLSPWEKDRTIPEALSRTDMGKDLLAQDYILKQITASLIYPEKKLGKMFWDRVYAKAQQLYGTTQVPINTFNKVWIMADRAEVFEHNQTAFVVDSHLKVMLEEDYLALQKHSVNPSSTVIPAPPALTGRRPGGKAGIHSLASQIVRQIILPQLEREVNTGKNFANLRQIVNSLILASWYKNNLKQALLNQVYSDKEKIKGIDLKDPGIKEQIYQRYLKAYKKGVFNFIKEDPSQGQMIPRKYFSGGWDPAMAAHPIVTSEAEKFGSALTKTIALAILTVGLNFNQPSPVQAAGAAVTKQMQMLHMDILGLGPRWGGGVWAYVKFHGKQTLTPASMMMEYGISDLAFSIYMPNDGRYKINSKGWETYLPEGKPFPVGKVIRLESNNQDGRFKYFLMAMRGFDAAMLNEGIKAGLTPGTSNSTKMIDLANRISHMTSTSDQRALLGTLTSEEDLKMMAQYVERRISDLDVIIREADIENKIRLEEKSEIWKRILKLVHKRQKLVKFVPRGPLDVYLKEATGLYFSKPFTFSAGPNLNALAVDRTTQNVEYHLQEASSDKLQEWARQKAFDSFLKRGGRPIEEWGETLNTLRTKPTEQWPFTVQDIAFHSPMLQPSFENTETVYGHLFFPKNSHGHKLPAVVLCGFIDQDPIGNALAIHLAGNGIAVLQLEMPMFAGRSPPNLKNISTPEKYVQIGMDAERFKRYILQSIADTLLGVRWLAGRPQIDASNMGVQGQSMLGSIAASAYLFDPDIRHLFVFAPVVRYPNTLLESEAKEYEEARQKAKENGVTLETLRQELDNISLMNLAKVYFGERKFNSILFTSVINDELVKPEDSRDFYEALGKPQNYFISIGPSNRMAHIFGTLHQGFNILRGALQMVNSGLRAPTAVDPTLKIKKPPKANPDNLDHSDQLKPGPQHALLQPEEIDMEVSPKGVKFSPRGFSYTLEEAKRVIDELIIKLKILKNSTQGIYKDRLTLYYVDIGSRDRVNDHNFYQELANWIAHVLHVQLLRETNEEGTGNTWYVQYKDGSSNDRDGLLTLGADILKELGPKFILINKALALRGSQGWPRMIPHADSAMSITRRETLTVTVASILAFLAGKNSNLWGPASEPQNSRHFTIQIRKYGMLADTDGSFYVDAIFHGDPMTPDQIREKYKIKDLGVSYNDPANYYPPVGDDKVIHDGEHVIFSSGNLKEFRSFLVQAADKAMISEADFNRMTPAAKGRFLAKMENEALEKMGNTFTEPKAKERVQNAVWIKRMLDNPGQAGFLIAQLPSESLPVLLKLLRQNREIYLEHGYKENILDNVIKLMTQPAFQEKPVIRKKPSVTKRLAQPLIARADLQDIYNRLASFHVLSDGHSLWIQIFAKNEPSRRRMVAYIQGLITKNTLPYTVEKDRGSSRMIILRLTADNTGASISKNLINFREIMLSDFKNRNKEGEPSADGAMKANPVFPGGIDLNTAGMQWTVNKEGKKFTTDEAIGPFGVQMNIDPAMIERIRHEGINSLSAVIVRITPVTNIWPLIGLQAPVNGQP